MINVVTLPQIYVYMYTSLAVILIVIAIVIILLRSMLNPCILMYAMFPSVKSLRLTVVVLLQLTLQLANA